MANRYEQLAGIAPQTRPRNRISGAASLAQLAGPRPKIEPNTTTPSQAESKALDEIAKSEAELRTIIDAIPQLILAIGTGEAFLYPNQAVLDYTGLTHEEVQSQTS